MRINHFCLWQLNNGYYGVILRLWLKRHNWNSPKFLEPCQLSAQKCFDLVPIVYYNILNSRRRSPVNSSSYLFNSCSCNWWACKASDFFTQQWLDYASQLTRFSSTDVWYTARATELYHLDIKYYIELRSQCCFKGFRIFFWSKYIIFYCAVSPAIL